MSGPRWRRRRSLQPRCCSASGRKGCVAAPHHQVLPAGADAAPAPAAAMAMALRLWLQPPQAAGAAHLARQQAQAQGGWRQAPGSLTGSTRGGRRRRRPALEGNPAARKTQSAAQRPAGPPHPPPAAAAAAATRARPAPAAPAPALARACGAVRLLHQLQAAVPSTPLQRRSCGRGPAAPAGRTSASAPAATWGRHCARSCPGRPLRRSALLLPAVSLAAGQACRLPA